MKKLIIIDDHSMILNGIASVVENRTDWQIAAKCSSIRDFENFISSNVIDNSTDKIVALVDIQLGEESGFDVLKRMQELGINAIIYSMYASPAYVIKSSENGAKGYLTKSSSDEELIRAIETVSEGGTYIQNNMVSDLMFTANIINCLTKKEKQIIDYIKQDLDNSKIAELMSISKRTVENHLSRLYDKFGVQNRHQLKEKLQAFLNFLYQTKNAPGSKNRNAPVYKINRQPDYN